MQSRVSRRSALGAAAAAVTGMMFGRPAEAEEAVIGLAMTPVLPTADLVLVDDLRVYLESATGRKVQLVTRRTYQSAASRSCSKRACLHWWGVPIWRGKPLYQSCLIW